MFFKNFIRGQVIWGVQLWRDTLYGKTAGGRLILPMSVLSILSSYASCVHSCGRFTECESYFRESRSTTTSAVPTYRKRCSTDSAFLCERQRNVNALLQPKRRSESVTNQSSDPAFTRSVVFEVGFLLWNYVFHHKRREACHLVNILILSIEMYVSLIRFSF